MAITNWQYDDLKSTLKALIEDTTIPNHDVLYHCYLHFERFELWMKRVQEAQWYEENERRYCQRKLDKIAKIIKEDVQ